MIKTLLKVFIILFLFTTFSYGDNTVTKIDIPSQASNHDWYSYWRMSFDSVGIKCIDTSTKQRVFVQVVPTETIQYDIESSITNPPTNEATQTTDLANASDLTGAYVNSYTMLSPFVCVRLETCTGTATESDSGIAPNTPDAGQNNWLKVILTDAVSIDGVWDDSDKGITYTSAPNTSDGNDYAFVGGFLYLNPATFTADTTPYYVEYEVPSTCTLTVTFELGGGR